MKNIEVLKDRIAKRQERIQRLTENIEKLLKKLEKIEATQYENEREKQWNVHDVERDIEDKARKIDQLLHEIEKYKREVDEYEAWRTKNRDVKVIWEFLERWKEHERRWYKSLREHYVGGVEYAEAQKEQARELEYKAEELIGFVSWSKRKQALEENAEAQAMIEEAEALRKEADTFYEMVAPVMMYLTDTNELDMAKLNRDLDYDALLMYDRFIDQIEHITGEITDVSNLRIGEKGELNGFVVGKEGKAKVQTIGAGGYNIQRFHFRTLVHEYK